MFIWSVCKQDVSSMHGIWNSRFCGRRKLPTQRKVDKIFQTFSPPSFNSVHIPQSLEITDAKISLRKSAIKSYFLLGQQFKNPTCGSNRSSDIDFFFFYGTEYTVILRKKKNSQDNLQMFLFQPTPFSICLVYTASFFFLLNILLRTVLWQFVNTPLMTKAQGK